MRVDFYGVAAALQQGPKRITRRTLHLFGAVPDELYEYRDGFLRIPVAEKVSRKALPRLRGNVRLIIRPQSSGRKERSNSAADSTPSSDHASFGTDDASN